LNRYLVASLLSLACLSTLPALAQSSGSTQPFVTLSVGGNPTASGVSLTGTVQPETPGSVPHPSGTVTFLDGTTVLNASGIGLTANPSASAQTFAQVFGTPDAAMAQVAEGELVGDFDGDGKDDLLLYGPVTSACCTKVQLFVSSNPGQGNFRALEPQIPNILYRNYLAPAALDVDGDGKLDLLLGQYVAYGNGDGTFSSRVGVLSVPTFNYAADVNGDGKLDILGIDTPPSPSNTPTVQLAFTVFRNDGSGTFTSLGSFPFGSPYQACCATYNVVGLSFGDVNGDGKLDIVSQMNSVPLDPYQSKAPVQFDVLLNNGDGTFGTAKPLDTSALHIFFWGAGVAFGDLNADGKQDLVLAYNAEDQGTGYLAAALGNGDGTFGPFSQLKLLPIGRTQVQLTDFDGDGKLDAILSSGEVALGKGDGTFAPPTSLFALPTTTSPQVRFLLQMPIYAHSSPSLVFLNLASGSNAVFTPQDSSSANTSVALSAGTHTLTAQYSGDSIYAAGVSPAITITAAPAVTTMTLTSSTNTIYATQSVTFTATLGNPAATGTVTFLDSYPGSDPLQPMLNPPSTTLATVTVANGVATLTTSQLPAGRHTITAAYGDVNSPNTAQLIENVNLPFSVANEIPIPLTAAPGKSGSTQLSIGALGGFSGPVTFGCYGSPATCSFSPATVNLAGTGASTVTLTITATRAPTTAQAAPSFSGTILACGIPLFALFGIASKGRPRALFAVIAIALCGISCLGCGGGGQQQASSSASLPAGSYPFYVTATSGQNESAINALLTVQ
jgi:hypothetical protein